MPIYDEPCDNFCEGCAARNTGDNFSHPGFCKSCMSSMMDAPTDDVLAGEDKLTDRLAKNADAKVGPLTSWRDTDGLEVEITLPLPPGVGKKDVRVKASVNKLLVAAGERKLLFVDPLYDDIVPDELVWCIERGADGVTAEMQISLAKFHPGTRWGKTLSKEGGAFECWTSQFLAEKAPAEEAAALPAASLAKDGSLKPRFTMRDDGGEVEVMLPLPPGLGTSKKDVQVTATPSELRVRAGERQLLMVELFDKIVPDDLVYTFDRTKGDAQVHMQLTLAKADEAVTWATLARPGGQFFAWTTEL